MQRAMSSKGLSPHPNPINKKCFPPIFLIVLLEHLPKCKKSGINLDFPVAMVTKWLPK